MADFQSIFSGARVLVTGHTGFCGSWLTLWLRQLGADVLGISLPPNTAPSLFRAACPVSATVRQVEVFH